MESKDCRWRDCRHGWLTNNNDTKILEPSNETDYKGYEFVSGSLEEFKKDGAFMDCLRI